MTVFLLFLRKDPFEEHLFESIARRDSLVERLAGIDSPR